MGEDPVVEVVAVVLALELAVADGLFTSALGFGDALASEHVDNLSHHRRHRHRRMPEVEARHRGVVGIGQAAAGFLLGLPSSQPLHLAHLRAETGAVPGVLLLLMGDQLDPHLLQSRVCGRTRTCAMEGGAYSSDGRGSGTGDALFMGLLLLSSGDLRGDDGSASIRLLLLGGGDGSGIGSGIGYSQTTPPRKPSVSKFAA